ncbi:MAG TPA: DinB family protein, partial [Acidobacteriaceae bacterium]|nr:DinB family protein [Acidobacteriaceae bacterium]
EPWLRGTHTEMPAALRAVIHALELAREDIDQWCLPLSDEAINARPGPDSDPIAPVAFHLRHIVRSLDRLLTYAEGEQLSPAQLAALKTELDPGAAHAELFSEFRKGIDDAIRRVEAFAGADLDQPRAVGRKALPTTVGGLLVHCADHTQRHTGQAITTAKLAQNLQSSRGAES